MAVALGMVSISCASGSARSGVCDIRPGCLPCNAKYGTIFPFELSSRLRYKMYGRKTATLNLRIAPEIKDAAERAAAEDHRSLTSLFEMLLISYLRERGFLPSAANPPSGGGEPGESDKPAGSGDPGAATRGKLGASRVPRAKKPAAPERKAEPAPRSKLEQIRALREQGAGR
jgi:hypothetical protein